MRCPKCGYISFDYQNICRKCNKDIGDAVTEVNGTVCEALPPAFLQLGTKKPFRAQPLAPEAIDPEIELADSVPEFGVREGIDTDFVLGDEETALTDDKEELVMDLDDLSEVSPREEYTLDLEESSGIEPDLPTLDFGDLDISDLAPPDKEQPASPQFEEELQLTTPEPVAALSENSPPQAKTLAPKSAGLEDLFLNGLNLDSPPKSGADIAPDERYSPSVKTGTVLDKFDIDLGELFEQNKK